MNKSSYFKKIKNNKEGQKIKFSKKKKKFFLNLSKKKKKKKKKKEIFKKSLETKGIGLVLLGCLQKKNKNKH